MSIPCPRSKDTRWVDPDEMLMGEFEHERLRCAAYSDGHILSRDGQTALCGSPLYVTPHEWEGFRVYLQIKTGVDVGEWWIAVDTRKGGLCTRCKNRSKDGIDDRFQRSAVAESHDQDVQEVEEEFEELSLPAMAHLVEGSPSERLARVRIDGIVSRVMRQLDAELVA